MKAIGERKAEKVGAVLPGEIDDWKTDELELKDLTALGGGISVKRTYTLEEKSITAKVDLYDLGTPRGGRLPVGLRTHQAILREKQNA